MNPIILLVEDNPDDALLTQLAFKKSKIANEFVTVSNGEAALDYLFGTGTYSDRDISQQPALILLDLNLPIITGLEVLQKIRSDPRTAMLPTIILTSSKEEQDLMNTYKSGCNSYIRKPVDSEQFAAAALQLQMYWLVLNTPPPLAGSNQS